MTESIFNPHHNQTSNGVTIVIGLEVIDYNRNRTTVVRDHTSPSMCCNSTDHTRSNDLATDPHEDCPKVIFCSHDHWFDCANGAYMNGSRLLAI